MGTNYALTYEPVNNYSTPVVRVFKDGAVWFTLSFTTAGQDINPHPNANRHVRQAAWEAYQAKFG